jgi:hypothetical protein
MTWKEVEVSEAFLAAWRLGHHEGLKACEAILWVLYNRFKAGWASATQVGWLGVIDAIPTSHYLESVPTTGYPDFADLNVRRLLLRAEDIVAERCLDSAGLGSILEPSGRRTPLLYWADAGRTAEWRQWFRERVSGRRHRLTLGNLWFWP